MDVTTSTRFTAVNGQEVSTSAAPNGTDAASRSVLITRPTPALPSADIPRRRSDERLRVVTEPDDWAQRSTNVDGADGGPSENSPRHSTTSREGREALGRKTSHKRKRTISAERQPSSTSSYQTHGLPRSPPRNLEHTMDSNGPAYRSRTSPGPDSSRNHSYSASPIPYSSRPEGGREQDRAMGPYYGNSGRSAYESQRSEAHDDLASTEHKMIEAIRRESVIENTHHLERRSESRTAGSADDRGSRGHSRATESGGLDSSTPTSGLPVDHRRRKRVFSNRTKTGCLTCRRRKKKCDELKPECNNCIRGGFVCEGYSHRVEWTKSSRDKAPVPLQSRDGDGTPSTSMRLGHPTSQHGESPHSVPGRGTEPNLLPYRAPPHAPHAGTLGHLSRPILLDDDREQGMGPASPKRRASQISSDSRPMEWNNTPSWSSGGHASYLNDHLPKQDFTRVPPIRDHPRSAETSDTTTTPQSAMSHRSLLNSQSSHSTSHSSTPNTPQSAQAQAQLALQHHNSLRARSTHRSEKEKMLAGELYFATAPELVWERDRCKASIWRFNNSMNPTLGISREERLRLFQNIVQPHEEPSSSSKASEGNPRDSPVGRVGENVIVEAPFICDYGYNITIARDVLIDSNCTIKDTCAVNIGARTVIGPNVKLLTATMPIDPRSRKGSRGPSLGRAITIEEDCWIGAGAIILPGLSVGKSSTVGAGSVVTRDVPPFTVVAGNPARVHRGIYPNDAPV